MTTSFAVGGGAFVFLLAGGAGAGAAAGRLPAAPVGA
eukprot:CAMPEP_0202764352 /NCGR_PEP_ID=MMETSP1388-20130828/25669_1 /ASSEMBLY_ACC=CAM_ASM_000864 /TAXON_ID=37098 /ORGANISM="Isochrysis sp, Strain CCMP1244" /LENGTH=36 /DNA_ID= /DNA_START= /DNA_END= /DNA_ORIENTATION=